VRFDGRDQNTAAVYKWNGATDSRRKADFLFATNAVVDMAEAVFDAPYAGNPGQGLAHRRRLLFFKKAADLPPFFVVADRFVCADAREHAYEQLWHLRGGTFADLSARAFRADYGDGVHLAGAHSDAAARFADKAGQTGPELQGWDPGDWQKHNAKPIATPVVCGAFTRARRLVTVLQPLRTRDLARRIVAVEASSDPASGTFSLKCADGRVVSLSE